MRRGRGLACLQRFSHSRLDLSFRLLRFPGPTGAARSFKTARTALLQKHVFLERLNSPSPGPQFLGVTEARARGFLGRSKPLRQSVRIHQHRQVPNGLALLLLFYGALGLVKRWWNQSLTVPVKLDHSLHAVAEFL